MSGNENVVNHEFKNYKKSSFARRRRRVRFVAILGAILMLIGIIGSIVYYI